MGPIADLMVDSGLELREFEQILREAVVVNISRRQIQSANRINKSGIAAAAGVTRAEVARILATYSPSSSTTASKKQDRSINRVLAGWREDPKFTTADGQPASLSMYGRGASFESLVGKFGRGLPPRAVLDELLRTNSVVVGAKQKVKLRSTVSIERGLSPQVIKSFGERAAQLMEAMIYNMKPSGEPVFVANVESFEVAPRDIPLMRREIASKGSSFLNEIHDTLSISKQERIRSRRSKHIAVTVYCYESDLLRTRQIKEVGNGVRRNFRRKSI